MSVVVMENPLRVGLARQRVPQPCALVIFGATGDLTRRKLVPALYNLGRAGLLPQGFAVVGFARREKDTAQFREEMQAAVDQFSRHRPVPLEVWQPFAESLYYHSATFQDLSGYIRLRAFLEQLDRERGTAGNRIFYLATPPSAFEEIFANLGAAGLIYPQEQGTPWSRLIVEKPFGRDLASARRLNRQLEQVCAEEQVFRMDHYLGKETVQNILVFRFANEIFEPLWNQKYIDHVQITVSEDLGMEGRGRFFEEAGILRDIVQNHILQLLCLVAMEPPISLEAEAIRDEKVHILRALRPLSPEEVQRSTVRGQYAAGWVNGQEVVGYRQEPGVDPESTTETFVALRLYIDNWRWAGVPFFLRSGKRLPKRATEIAIQFKAVPRILFNRNPEAPLEPNVLALRIQPDEGVSLRFGAKVPELATRVQPVKMDFRYGTAFGMEPPEAYERLLLDAILGDSTLFTRRDEVEAAWSFITPILEGWQAAPSPAFPNYTAGSWGPAEADALMAPEGRAWRRL
jgi:glucose-6-phosphate 1-dehydrogenase